MPARCDTGDPWHVACFLGIGSRHAFHIHMQTPSHAFDTSDPSTDAPAAFALPRGGHELERWAGVALASAAVAYGLSRRSLPGVAIAAAAVPLAFRGLTGQWPGFVNPYDDTRVALGGSRGIHVREAIRLEVPLDVVYQFWRRLENLPRFMSHVREVHDLGDGRSHWVAEGPGDMPVEWDAEIVNEVENQVIGWRSVAGSDIATAGAVRFATVRQGSETQVSVHLQWAAPGGRATRLLALVLGHDPAHMIREDLRRLKQLMEAGEVPRTSRGASA
jgi:uncharacterized membrane protein